MITRNVSKRLDGCEEGHFPFGFQTLQLIQRQFGALTYHIKTSHVAILSHEVRGNLSVVVRVNTMGSSQEPEEFRVWVKRFTHVK